MHPARFEGTLRPLAALTNLESLRLDDCPRLHGGVACLAGLEQCTKLAIRNTDVRVDVDRVGRAVLRKASVKLSKTGAPLKALASG